MTKKLKLFSMAALVAVAAATASQAATVAPITSATVLQSINVALTIYPSNTITAGDKKDDILKSTVKPASVTTKTVVQALGSALGTKFGNAAKLVLLTQYVDTNVFVVLETNVSLNGTNIITTVSTNYYTSTNWAGLTNGGFLTIATNVVFTNTSTSPVFAVDDGGTITLLTNKTFYPPYPDEGVEVNTNVMGYFDIFGQGAIGYTYNGSNDWYFNGTTKATNGNAIFGTSSGTTYSKGISISLNSPGDLTLSGSSGVGNTSVVSKNVGTAKSPLFINYLDGSWSVSGSGYMGGKTISTTDTNNNTTTDLVTNSVPFVFKGTVSASGATVSH